ncbi:MAG TPA: YciI family protein [Chloroflexota bacterium]|jgi:hypothetical protein
MRYVLMFDTAYASLEDALQRAPIEIQAHLARTRDFHARGLLLEAGAFRDADRPLSTMAILTSREAAEDYAAGDPFMLNGMVTHYSIREWTDALGRSA